MHLAHTFDCAKYFSEQEKTRERERNKIEKKNLIKKSKYQLERLLKIVIFRKQGISMHKYVLKFRATNANNNTVAYHAHFLVYLF